jgi:hypothetical protein
VARVRLSISHKFLAVLAVLAPLILAVAFAGVVGLGSMKSEFDRVFADGCRPYVKRFSLFAGRRTFRLMVI